MESMKQQYDYEIEELVVKNTELETRITFLEGQGECKSHLTYI